MIGLKKLLKYFEEPLSFLEQLLEIMGIATMVPGQRPWRYIAVAVIEHFMHFNAFFVTFVYLFTDKPFNSKLESAQCTVSLLHMYPKFINLQFNRGPYRKLVISGKRLWEEVKALNVKQDIMREFNQETMRNMKFILLFHAAGMPFSAAIATLTNFLLPLEERRTVYEVWDPFPEPWYFTNCIYEMVVMCMCLLLLGSTTVVSYAHCRQAAAGLHFVSALLEDEQPDIKVCVRLHQTVLQYTKDIETYFSGQMIWEVILSSLLAAIRAYMTLVTLGSGSPKAVTNMFFWILCYVGPCIICLSGQAITDNNEKLFRNAYVNSWYSAPHSDKTCISLIMTRAKKAIRLSYRGLMDFNLERFSLVVQASYSYITLLKGADV